MLSVGCFLVLRRKYCKRKIPMKIPKNDVLAIFHQMYRARNIFLERWLVL